MIPSPSLLILAALATASGIPPQEVGPPVRILAASSLSRVLPGALAATDPDSGGAARQLQEVAWNFDASSRLARQAASGAPADVMILADEAWVRWALDRGLVAGEVRDLATNRLVVAARDEDLPAGWNPGQASAWPAEAVLLAGENVPAGRYAREALESLGVWDSLAPRVVRSGSSRATVETLAAGGADLAVVYGSEVVGDPRLRVLAEIPPGTHQPIRYLAFAVTGGDTAAAERVLARLQTPGVGQALVEAGFGRPGGGGWTPASPSAPASTPGVPVHLPDVGGAIRLSLLVAALATGALLPLALLLGWVLARKRFPGRSLLSMLILVPLVLPPVVTGFLLLTVLSPRSPLGSVLAGLGLEVPFTLLGAVVAAAVVGMPLYVAAIRGAFEGVDPHLEEMAWTLGDRPRRSFLRVSLPLAAPGIAAGAILAFARALGEFGATVVLAGNQEGETRTIALAVYTLLEAPEGRTLVWTLVGASLLLSAGALLGYEILNRRQRERLEVHR